MIKQHKAVTLELGDKTLHGVQHVNWALFTHATSKSGKVMGFDSLYDELKPKCVLEMPVKITRKEDGSFRLFSLYGECKDDVSLVELNAAMDSFLKEVTESLTQHVVSKNMEKVTQVATESGEEGCEKLVMELLCKELCTTPEVMLELADSDE